MSIADAPPAQELVERAEALVPMLRDNAAATEQARRVLPEHFDALAEAGVFRMCAPRRFGGYEADFRTQIDALAAVARGCPSTSWVATIFSAMGWLAGCFPDDAQEEIFADGDPRMSGVFAPIGSGIRVDGGIRVSGRWPFNTGCHGARWTCLNLILQEGEGVPTTCFVPSSELTILDDWNASGMAGTGSNSVVADDVFVPDHRWLPLQALLDGVYPQRHNSDGPYFNLPTVPVLVVNAGGTPLGIAQGALEAFHERLPGRGIAFTDYTSQAEAPLTHLQVGEATLKLDSVRAHVYRAAAILDDYLGGPMSTEARVKSRAHISYATGLVREVVDTLFYASGASSIQSHVPIQRFQRDAQAIANHGILLPSTTTELYGRILCGLEPNTTLF
jgi:3-hydroxy-9,10-secoandrosta-1,3,5(10)-triene-9,17-dione monooxygenase